MSSLYETEITLGQAMFGNAQLGDKRRNKRAATTFDQMRRHPGGTLPEKLASPADLKALYNLCDCKDVTHAALFASMRDYVFGRIDEVEGPILLLHDATELDYTTRTSISDDLGQIGKGTRRGYVCQNVLAVSADSGEVLGLVDQILHCRVKVPKNETLPQHRDRKTRESLLWPKGTKHLPADARLIDVADQGASTFEFLEHEYNSGRRFVIRNGQQRKVYAGHEPVGPKHDMKEYVKSSPELGRFTMDVQAQKGRKARKGAEFVVHAVPVMLCPPHAKYGNHGDDPLSLWVVQVTEVNPPSGEKTIEWTLITNEPVRSFKDAWRVTGWYERRWIIEEYHKAMKTGCRIAGMQFTKVERLQVAIALISAVATTLLNLRDASRRADAHTRRATTLLAREYVEVLSVARYHKIRLDITVHEFYMALARLGGHQNRKHDHAPGWLVLWRGWTKLQSMLDGYLIAKRKKCG
ncbi:MAG: IS4 family transposase [Planctomycetota bacterium]|nr:IS4 family transposase [Planctomycetota bacterium]